MSSILIGVLRRPHGVAGAVKVESYSGESDHFRALKGVEVELVGPERQRTVTVDTVDIHNGVPVLHFSGIDSPEEIRAYGGWNIRVDGAFAAPRGPEEYYLSEIVGCTLVNGGESLGVVEAVVDGGQAPLLEVRRTTGTVYVPFMQRFIGDIDVPSRTIEVRERWVLDIE
jgi:16S rRNA processing protein RimM